MKPNFESPAHTARDLVERDITVFLLPGSHIWRQLLSQSDIPEYRKIAESMIITKSYDQFDAMTKNEMLSRGTHAMMRPYLFPFELAWATEVDDDQGVTIVSTEYVTQKGEYKYNHGRGYYKGEKLVFAGRIPGGGYLTHKKWHLNEVFNTFLKIIFGKQNKLLMEIKFKSIIIFRN